MSRKRTLLGLAITVVLALGFAGSNVHAKGKKSFHQNGKFSLRVFADLASLDLAFASGTGAAFYIRGDICADPTAAGPCGRVIGDFECWGWQVAPGTAANFALVAQEFNLFDIGKIQTQGVEDAGPRAVTGGTGAFRNVRGEATGSDLSGFPPEFIITFRLIGVKK